MAEDSRKMGLSTGQGPKNIFRKQHENVTYFIYSKTAENVADDFPYLQKDIGQVTLICKYA